MASSILRPSKALEKARDLIGQWPHARPPDPDQWVKSIASVLAQFPPALVDECCDPRRGLAKVREFPPTVAAVFEWCEARMQWYQAVASYIPVPVRPMIEAGPKTAEDIAALLSGLAEQLRADNSRSPLDMLINQRAAMRRESVERVLLYAERIAPKAEP